MRKLLILSFVVITICSSAQTKNFVVDVHIECLIYKNDTLKFGIPKIISLKNLGRSAIISLGKVRENEYAIQYELLRSNIGQSEYFMLGKCFYIKDPTGWKEISRFDYHQLLLNEDQHPNEIPNTNQSTCGAENDGEGLEFGCWYVFYKT